MCASQTRGQTPSLIFTEFLYGLDAAERERVAALRAQGSFFWLDASLSETSRDDLVAALDPPGHALPALPATGDARVSRTFHADRASIGFALRCHVESRAPADPDASRLRPLRVQVVLTSDYLLTLHDERVSLPAILAADLPPEWGGPSVVYSVLDAMLASTFEALEDVELTLDALVATWTDRDGELIPRATLREAGARLVTMRRWVTAEQAVFGPARRRVGRASRLRCRRGAVLRSTERAGRPPARVDRTPPRTGWGCRWICS